MNKLLIISLLIILLISCCVIFFHSNQKPTNTNTGRYYGPVPEGYNQEYFWETGIMKKLKEDNNGA